MPGVTEHHENFKGLSATLESVRCGFYLHGARVFRGTLSVGSGTGLGFSPGIIGFLSAPATDTILFKTPLSLQLIFSTFGFLGLIGLAMLFRFLPHTVLASWRPS